MLEASDGNRFAAFEATPDRPTGIGIAILPDVRGLSRFYEELALRFAERGYTAIAFDYFGRTAGVGKREDFQYREHVQQTTTAGVQADLAAVIARLQEANSVVFTVGFCFEGASPGSRRRKATTCTARSGSTGVGPGPGRHARPDSAGR